MAEAHQYLVEMLSNGNRAPAGPRPPQDLQVSAVQLEEGEALPGGARRELGGADDRHGGDRNRGIVQPVPRNLADAPQSETGVY